jgi:cleavage and polyadenylation specificity factor subunit 1
MRVYAVLVSTSVPTRMKNDDNQYIDGKETDERGPGEFLPEMEQFSMILVSPVTWEIVDKVEFEEFEQCFSLECALLDSKQTSTGRKYYMIIGTGTLKGEDTTMKGSVKLFRINAYIYGKLIIYNRFVCMILLKLCLNQIIHKLTTSSSLFLLKMLKEQ